MWQLLVILQGLVLAIIPGILRSMKDQNRKNQSKRRTKEDAESTEQAKIKALNAINLVRRGKAPTLSAAARAKDTTVESIRRLLPAALFQDRPGGRIQVKASDPYTALVEIITDLGPVDVTARGSRERQLAGQHRATVTRVLRGKEPDSSLKQFLGKTVGGHKLLTSPYRLSILAEAGFQDQLDSLYVSPETRG